MILAFSKFYMQMEFTSCSFLSKLPVPYCICLFCLFVGSSLLEKLTISKEQNRGKEVIHRLQQSSPESWSF